mgnify:FL=1
MFEVYTYGDSNETNRIKQKIPEKIYEQVLEHTVISAVDAIIYHQGKVLLSLRKQEPCKGQWWIPGGRQYKGETGEEAVVRKVKEELGLDVDVKKLVGIYDVSFDKTAFQNVKTGIHYVARVYLVQSKEGMSTIQLYPTQTQFRWIEKIEEDLDDYVKTALLQSGVFEK